MDDYSPPPTKIREARTRLGLTQDEAAKKVGRTMRTWRYWEAGTITMPPEMWERWIIRTKQPRAGQP
jgi:DNA-binding XRE family transcriptional regulator